MGQPQLAGYQLGLEQKRGRADAFVHRRLLQLDDQRHVVLINHAFPLPCQPKMIGDPQSRNRDVMPANGRPNPVLNGSVADAPRRLFTSPLCRSASMKLHIW